MAKFTDATEATLPTNTKNEIGNRYGKLTVIQFIDDPRPGAYWKCKCDCGGEVVVSGCNLRNGIRTSCDSCEHGGAGQNVIDEVGNIYGELEVIEHAPPPATVDQNTSTAYWRCHCSCGNKDFVVKGQALRSGNAWHCGCLHSSLLSEAKMGNTNRRKHIPEGLAGFEALYKGYQHNAKKRDRAFELTKEDFSFLTKMNCFYCGDKPFQVKEMRHREGQGDYEYNGLDRIDPTKGYTLDNVVPCCGVCNWMKRDYQMVPFLWHIQKISIRRGLR